MGWQVNKRTGRKYYYSYQLDLATGKMKKVYVPLADAERVAAEDELRRQTHGEERALRRQTREQAALAAQISATIREALARGLEVQGFRIRKAEIRKKRYANDIYNTTE